ncbi:hypothetical protein KAR91_16180 [Candidatus Pacearchaeota archaeon]|nr:hypothetical protein [Candidatus Pacearchaeota archaeon]
MAKKNTNTSNDKPSDKVIKTPEKKGKMYKIKSEKQLGFKKRNYFIDNKNVLIVAGGEVDEKTYHLFDDYARKIFFE